VAKKKAGRQPTRPSSGSRRAVPSARSRQKGFPRPRESDRRRQARACRILAELQKAYPDARIALAFTDPLELLVAVLLSAQCTDERVNMVTPTLFRTYRSARDYAEADPADLEKLIYATGFFHQKTRAIQGACRQIVERHQGRVPETMDALLALEGVARKTANVVLSTTVGKNEGVVVDTHVGRVAMRLALAPSARDDKDAVRIERDLMGVLPQDQWGRFGDMAVWHGRRRCTARRPDCAHCALTDDCPSAMKVVD